MHWAWAVAQKPFDAAARQSFTREVAASYLVSPSRLQVARQSYILEVSHIHLCDWRRSLAQNLPFQQILPTLDFFYLPDCLHDNGTRPDLSWSSFYF